MMAIERRALLQRAFLLAGATLTPTFGFEALAKADAAPPLLDAARFNLLSAVADTMVPRTDTPGALDAGVPKLFDGLLRNWASAGRRAELIAALDKIDTLAREKERQGFAKLAPNKRHELLARHDVEALQPRPPGSQVNPNPLQAAPSVADPNYGRLKQESSLSRLMAGPPVADPGYAKLKELIVVLFYYSEPALTHDLEYEHSPGEWRPSIPITPQTRPSGGAGLV